MTGRVFRCPTCKREVSTHDSHFPFCSHRCRLIDLGKWLEGEYSVPGEQASNEEPAPENENEAEE